MKRSSNRLVLLVGIFLAVVAFVLIAVMFSGGGGGISGPTAAPVTAKVVVAAKDLALGTKITADAVSTKDVAVADKPLDSYGDTSQVIGQTVRQNVTSGQLITSVVLNSGGSVQDISVPPGLVGIAVQVDQVTGVGTLIKPGDRVDVVTQFSNFPLAPSGAPGAPGAEASSPAELQAQNTVKTIVEGLQVLGTLLPPAQDNGQPAPSGQTGTSLTGQQQIVILAATSQQAEAIRFAQVNSTAFPVALVLRSANDCQAQDGTPSPCPIIPTTGVNLRVMVDQFGVLPPQVVQGLAPGRLYPSPSPSPLPGAASPSANP